MLDLIREQISIPSFEIAKYPPLGLGKETGRFIENKNTENPVSHQSVGLQVLWSGLAV